MYKLIYMLIRIISNRRNNVNKKGNNSFLNGRLTQLIQKKTIVVNITNGADYVQTGLTENDIPISAELVGYTSGALLKVDFGFIRHNNKTLLKFNNASGSAIGNKSVILYYITIE